MSNPATSSLQLPQQTDHSFNSVMIDLEGVTLVKAREIRSQIESDIQQLRNRVRMLQEQEERAIKQIRTTKEKTARIRQMMTEREAHLIEKIKNQEIQTQDVLQQKGVIQQKRMQHYSQYQIRIQEDQISKLKIIKAVKLKKEEDRLLIKQNQIEQQLEINRKKQEIEQQARWGQHLQSQFLLSKVSKVRAEKPAKVEKVIGEIKSLENEAYELEKVESELLQKLQKTQVAEHETVFKLQKTMAESQEARAARRIKSSSGVRKPLAFIVQSPNLDQVITKCRPTSMISSNNKNKLLQYNSLKHKLLTSPVLSF